MTDPESADPDEASLVRYIEANRDQYNREVLTNMLLRAGHAPETIAEAWRLADAGAAEARVAAGHEPNRARQRVLSGIAILLAFGAFAVGEFALIAASHGRPMMLLYLLLFPLQILFVTRWIVGRIGASGSLRRGDLAMTVGWLVIPVIAMLALMGVCFGYGGAFGCVLECPQG